MILTLKHKHRAIYLVIIEAAHSILGRNPENDIRKAAPFPGARDRTVSGDIDGSFELVREEEELPSSAPPFLCWTLGRWSRC